MSDSEIREGEREPVESQRITGRTSNLLCRMIDEIAELRKATIFEVMADYGLQIELMPIGRNCGPKEIQPTPDESGRAEH